MLSFFLKTVILYCVYCLSSKCLVQQRLIQVASFLRLFSVRLCPLNTTTKLNTGDSTSILFVNYSSVLDWWSILLVLHKYTTATNVLFLVDNPPEFMWPLNNLLSCYILSTPKTKDPIQRRWQMIAQLKEGMKVSKGTIIVMCERLTEHKPGTTHDLLASGIIDKVLDLTLFYPEEIYKLSNNTNIGDVLLGNTSNICIFKIQDVTSQFLPTSSYDKTSNHLQAHNNRKQHLLVTLIEDLNTVVRNRNIYKQVVNDIDKTSVLNTTWFIVCLYTSIFALLLKWC